MPNKRTPAGFTTLLATGFLLAGVSIAFAHVTLETGEAAIGSAYKAVLRVPHGCEGKATTAIRVKMPDGFVAVKPMPKPGWKLETVKGKYAKPYKLRGETVDEGVVEVKWSGGNLPDEFYDEFVMRGQLAANLAAGEKLYFPVVQECGEATERWIETPQAGQSEDSLDKPTPALTLVPKK
jgi:uncharacterized protein YcnI